MGTNSEIGQSPQAPSEDRGEAGSRLLEVIQELDADEIPESGLSNFDVLMGFEELYPGFIDLVSEQIPETNPETIGSQLSVVMKEVATELAKKNSQKLLP